MLGKNAKVAGSLLAIVGAVMVALNVVSDLGEPDATVFELVLDGVETLLMVFGAGGVVLLLLQIRADHRERLDLIRDLSVARTEGEQWRRRVQTQLAGIGAEIDKQFGVWRLTGAEREVGLMMLKGLSHKEIASMRGTSEATVRQQARSVYQKSNLPSKTAFAAYFLEDLLPPTQTQTESSAHLTAEPGPDSMPVPQYGMEPGER